MAFTLNDLKYDPSKSAEENVKNVYKYINNMATLLNYTLNNLDASDIVVSNGESLNELYQSGALRGADGRDGVDGRNGTNGTNGQDGQDGQDGVGVPAGGTTGQVLVKRSNADYDTQWVDPTDL